MTQFLLSFTFSLFSFSSCPERCLWFGQQVEQIMTSCGRCFSGTSLASLKHLIMTLYSCHLGRLLSSVASFPASPRPAAFSPGSGQSGPTGQTLQSGTSEPLGPDQSEGSRLFCCLLFKNASSRSASLLARRGHSFSGTPRQIKVPPPSFWRTIVDSAPLMS